MKYRLVEDWNEIRFERTINVLMSRGWLPQGGVSIGMCHNGGVYYAQAMVCCKEQDKLIKESKKDEIGNIPKEI